MKCFKFPANMKRMLEDDDCIIVDDSGRARVRKKKRYGDRAVWDETTGEKLIGVGKTPSGKYDCKITHPVTKKTVWIGTFSTPEEASYAYAAKKREFEAARADKVRESEARKGFEWVEVDDVAEENNGSNSRSEQDAVVEDFEWIREEPVMDSQSDHLHTVPESAPDDEPQPDSEPIQEPEPTLSEQVETDTATEKPEQPSEPNPDESQSHNVAFKSTEEHQQYSPEAQQSPGSTHGSNSSTEELTGTTSQTVSEQPDECGERQREGPESGEEPSTTTTGKEEGKQVISVKSQYYNGGGAMGYLVPSPNDLSSKGSKSGSMMKIFVPIIDFHGHLLGKFWDIDGSLNITPDEMEFSSV